MHETLRFAGLGLTLLVAACGGSSEQTAAQNSPVEQPADQPQADTPPADADADAPPTAPPPAEVDLDAVEDLESLFTVSGNLDKERVSGVIGQRKPDVYKCYSDALAANPGLAGRVLIQITTTPAGGVASAMVKQTTLGNAGVEQCMVGKIRTWKFPDDPSGGLTVIKYAFQLPP